MLTLLLSTSALFDGGYRLSDDAIVYRCILNIPIDTLVLLSVVVELYRGLIRSFELMFEVEQSCQGWGILHIVYCLIGQAV